MTAKPICLEWRGTETVEAANAALDARIDVELRLPAGYHNAVHARVQSPDDPSAPALVDVEGDAVLLGRLASVRGLEGLSRLRPPSARVPMRIRVLSPSPTILIRVLKEQSV